MSKILIVEDEESIAELEKDYLELSGFEVEIENNGTDGLERALKEEYDLLILDLMLPGTDGFEICRRVREVKNTPIIMVSAKKEDIDKIRGLGLGADDYITKPFKPSLLYAKCLALLKRNKKIETNQLQSGKVILDLDKHILVIEENDIVLTDKEFKLLRYLMKNQGIVLSREKILDTLWGYDYYGDGRAVDTYIKRLRKRLGKYSYYIQTIVKTGYMWKGEES